MERKLDNQSAAANRRPAEQSDGSGNFQTRLLQPEPVPGAGR